jgi:hypothetical protein
MHIKKNNKRTTIIIIGVPIKSLNDSQMRALVYQARTENVVDWVTAIQQYRSSF